MKKNKGFTLFELLVVLAVITVLVLLAFALLGNRVSEAKITNIKHDVKVVSNLMDEELSYSLELPDYLSSIDLDSEFDNLKIYDERGLIKNKNNLEMGIFYEVNEIESIKKINSKLIGKFVSNNNGKVYYLESGNFEISNACPTSGLVPINLNLSLEVDSGYTLSNFIGGDLEAFLNDNNNKISMYEKNGDTYVYILNYNYILNSKDGPVNVILETFINVSKYYNNIINPNDYMLANYYDKDYYNINSLGNLSELPLVFESYNNLGERMSNCSSFSLVEENFEYPSVNLVGHENGIIVFGDTSENTFFKHVNAPKADYFSGVGLDIDDYKIIVQTNWSTYLALRNDDTLMYYEIYYDRYSDSYSLFSLNFGVINNIKEITSDKMLITNDNRIYHATTASGGVTNITEVVIPGGFDSFIDTSPSNYYPNPFAAKSLNGEIYVWGNNSNGHLGVGPTDSTIINPIKIPFDGDDVKEFGANAENAYVLLNNGELYVSGQNNSGIMGNVPDYNSYNEYINVSTNISMNNIKEVKLRSRELLFLTDDNKLYGMGANYNGGIAATGTMVYQPNLILENVKIFKTSGFNPSNYSFAITNNNEFYAWGESAGDVFDDSYDFYNYGPILISGIMEYGEVVQTEIGINYLAVKYLNNKLLLLGFQFGM